MLSMKSILSLLLFGITSTLAEERLPLTYEAISETYLQYTIQPWNPDVRKKMGTYAFKAALAHYNDKKYRKSAIGCYWTLSFDASNLKALRLLNHLKKKHAVDLGNVSEIYE